VNKIVECVPNFSEGKDKSKIQAIAKAVESIRGVVLLDVDPNISTNRTVFTFCGKPDAVLEAAYQAIKVASNLIDMRQHKGEHPRMGATDVCPFVPVKNVTMEECVTLAKKLGKRIADEFDLPVYLYEYAATQPQRKNLAEIRKGEYEGLPEKLKKPEWAPDFGPTKFNPKLGATVVGARDFLIAYNVNVNTRDVPLTKKIALTIREKGKFKRDKNGKIVRDEHGNKLRVPGRLKACKATAWYIEEYGYAQVTMNLTNYKITPPHIAYETIKEEAEKLGLVVTGSELVGLIPLEALLMAGNYYLKKQGKSAGIPEREIVHIAVRSLGLNDSAPFDVDKKVIEYAISRKEKLTSMSLSDFNDLLSTDTPAPGGGSVAAYACANGSALFSMVANLTFKKKEFKDFKNEMETIAEKTQKIKNHLLYLVDEDTEAFNKLMQAMKTKAKTEKEKLKKQQLIEQATQNAANVPYQTMVAGLEALTLGTELAEKALSASISDVSVGALMLTAGIEGAYKNVLINLKSITDENFKQNLKNKADEILKQAHSIKNNIENIVSNKL